jgi:hypothetical protein
MLTPPQCCRPASLHRRAVIEREVLKIDVTSRATLQTTQAFASPPQRLQGAAPSGWSRPTTGLPRSHN